jgi:hypothetical protein
MGNISSVLLVGGLSLQFLVELEFELETDSPIASNLEDFSSMGKI